MAHHTSQIASRAAERTNFHTAAQGTPVEKTSTKRGTNESYGVNLVDVYLVQLASAAKTVFNDIFYLFLAIDWHTTFRAPKVIWVFYRYFAPKWWTRATSSQKAYWLR